MFIPLQRVCSSLDFYSHFAAPYFLTLLILLLVKITWTDYIIIFVLSVVGVILSSTMFTAQMQFFCRLSDPLLGGTYMCVWLPYF